MLELLERPSFHLSLTLGRLLRSTRYSTVQIVPLDGELRVRKQRTAPAPLLIWMGGPLMTVLNTGVRVLPQGEWAERERLIWQTLHRRSIRIDRDGALLLPVLPGRTLSALLEDPAVDTSRRLRAIGLAVVALAEFHASGFTHGDAMAENVMVDLEAGVARWFDFETMHESNRRMAWRRADDLRALLSTCLLRCNVDDFAAILRRIRDVYADDAIIPPLAASFTSRWSRPLIFHLGQAALSLPAFKVIGALLNRLSWD